MANFLKQDNEKTSPSLYEDIQERGPNRSMVAVDVITSGENEEESSFDYQSEMSSLTMSAASSADKTSQIGSKDSSKRRSSDGNTILPRTSYKARISDRTSQLNLDRFRFDELPLIGRETQIEELCDAFKQVVEKYSTKSTNSRGLVFVRGESGVGKSSLIQHASFERLVRKHRGLLTFSKCEVQQQIEEEPYASVQDSMNLLCYAILDLPRRRLQEDSLTETTSSYSSASSSIQASKVTFEDVQDKLTEELDPSERNALIDAVPGLEKIMVVENQQSNNQDTGLDDNLSLGAVSTRDGSTFKESSDRLKFVFRHFIRVISSVCPLVFVLDDCQWADKASLEWIKYLLTDVSSARETTAIVGPGNNANRQQAGSSLLVVACYRSDEIGDDRNSILSQMIKEFEELSECRGSEENKDKTPNEEALALLFRSIDVGNLTLENLNTMLVELLARDPQETMELAQTLHKKSKIKILLFCLFVCHPSKDMV